MSEQALETIIREDGLRFVSRATVAPTAVQGLRSCIFCGQHRPRSQMIHRKVMGTYQLVCQPSCRNNKAGQGKSITPP